MRSGEAPAKEIQIASAAFGCAEPAGDGFEPLVRNTADNIRDNCGRQLCVSRGGGLLDIGRPGQQDMLADLREGRFDLLFLAVPVMVEEERGSVVDGVKLAMPYQQICIARRAV